MKVLFIGPQGSGKSTQARMLAEHLGVPFLSFGELLRELAKEDTAEGKQLKVDMSAGKLVDDWVAAKVMKERVEAGDCENGFVSDGYARSLHQLSLYDPNFDYVIHMDVSDDEVVKRLGKRSQTEGRQDDNAEAIKVRLESYHKYTKPVLDKYKGEDKLITVSGVGEISQIQKIIRQSISKNG